MVARNGFLCQQCGHGTPRWMGRCPNCGGWNTLVEEPRRVSRTNFKESKTLPRPVSEVLTTVEDKLPTGIGEIDRVLGGGFVTGSLVLLGGDPGIGKSTLLLQVADMLAGAKKKVLYVSAEESVRQVGLRASRLGVCGDELFLVSETDIDSIESYIRDFSPSLVVVDSIQTVCRNDLGSAPGTVGQVRECAAQLMRLAKTTGISVVLIGHVTKEGLIAGPRVLEHMVDTVLYLEGERYHTFRILRGVKNRFGSTNEIGVFEMSGTGLTEVSNPSHLFLQHNPQGAVPGSVVVSTMEGSRPLLVEIQALVCPSGFGTPRRMTTGIDHNRVALIMAVLEKRMGLRLGSCDAYVNAVGGVRIEEPAADLGVALAIASSFKDLPLKRVMAVAGEIGLTGEIRPVAFVEKRVSEAKRLGFGCSMIPWGGNEKINAKGIDLFRVATLPEAMEFSI